MTTSRKDFERLTSFQPYDRPTNAMFDRVGQMVADMSGDKSGACGNGYTLTLVGPSGCGKTMLSKSVQKYAYTALYHYDRYVQGIGGTITGVRDVMFIEWAELLNTIRSGKMDDYQWKQIKSAWFLAIDDIGAGYETQNSVAKLLELVNARVGSWTIYNANLSVEAIKKLDERIASRLYREGGKVLELTTAQDFNQRRQPTEP